MLRLAPREVVARRAGDAWYLESPIALADYPPRLGDVLRRAAASAPSRDFLIERREGGLRRVTYAEALAAAEGVADWLRVRMAIASWNAKNRVGSTRVWRALLLREPPSIDAGEITDKGYTNQRATIERRAADVFRLYAEPPDEDVITFD